MGKMRKPPATQIQGPVSLQRPMPHKYKAGVFIFGEMAFDGQNQLCAVAPWTQGNFSDDNRKAYLLPKGTVDAGEASLEAAIREVKEETGIDIDRILDPNKKYEIGGKKKRGGELTPDDREQLGLYPNVELEYWLKDGQPVFRGIIPTNRGNPAHHTMFGIKVKGIEHLRDSIKHKDNGGKDPLVTRTVQDMVAEGEHQHTLPTFDELLQTLRTGIWTFGPNQNHGRLFDPNFRETEKYFLFSKRHQQMQRAVTELIANPGFTREELLAVVQSAQQDFDAIERGERVIQTPQELDELFHTTHIQNTVKDDLKKIRKFMEGKGEYAKIYRDQPLISDSTGLKLDTKQHPLRYYQESADIIPIDAWLNRMIEFSKDNRGGQYHLSQFNRTIHDRAPGRVHLGRHHSIADATYRGCQEAVQALRDENRETIFNLKDNVLEEIGKVLDRFSLEVATIRGGESVGRGVG